MSVRREWRRALAVAVPYRHVPDVHRSLLAGYLAVRSPDDAHHGDGPGTHRESGVACDGRERLY
jgi:hypothetical protein